MFQLLASLPGFTHEITVLSGTEVDVWIFHLELTMETSTLVPASNPINVAAPCLSWFIEFWASSFQICQHHRVGYTFGTELTISEQAWKPLVQNSFNHLLVMAPIKFNKGNCIKHGLKSNANFILKSCVFSMFHGQSSATLWDFYWQRDYKKLLKPTRISTLYKKLRLVLNVGISQSLSSLDIYHPFWLISWPFLSNSLFSFSTIRSSPYWSFSTAI